MPGAILCCRTSQSGPQTLQVDGRLAVGGPFNVALRAITVPDEGTQTLEAIVLKPLVPEGPCALIAVSGDGQTGAVETRLAAPLVVAVVQAGGTPVPGVPVTFTVTTGQGTLAPGQPVLTDAQGRAAVTLTLGTQAGKNRVTATAPGLAPVTFTVTGVTWPTGQRLIQVSGNNQAGEPGESPPPLVVRLEDQLGQTRGGGARHRAGHLRGGGLCEPTRIPGDLGGSASAVADQRLDRPDRDDGEQRRGALFRPGGLDGEFRHSCR